MILQKITSTLIVASILSGVLGSDSLLPASSPFFLSQNSSSTMRTGQVDNLGDLPQWLADAVRWDLAIEVKISPGRLFVAEAKRETWPNSCLGLAQPEERCDRSSVEGWRIVFSDGGKSWTYRTDIEGRMRRLESQLNATMLPNAVRSAVLKDAFERSPQQAMTVQIIGAEKQIWPDSCLGLNDGICARVFVPGWEVTVEMTTLQQRWIYRTNEDGSQVRLVERGDRLEEPSSFLVNAVLRDLSTRTNIPTNDLQLASYTRRVWEDNCLELRQPREVCDRLLIDGWRLAIFDNRDAEIATQWFYFYRTNLDGRLIRFEPDNALIASLPNGVTEAILSILSDERNLPISQLQITEATRETWPNGCLGIPSDSRCTRGKVEGWRVVVEHQGTRWVYRTDNEGSVVVLETEEKRELSLPENITQLVLQEASQRSGLPTSDLRIIKAQQQQWSDSCLGLERPGFLCAQVIVPGWLVTVGGGDKIWVYHTNESGSQIVFNPDQSF